MIRCDTEGVTGITTYEQAEASEFGRRMLMNDLSACIDGLLCEGEHEIVIYDEHTDGRNVRLEDLPPEVSVICGKPRYTSEWGGIDSTYDAMLMVGFHARSGVSGALLPHSYSRSNLTIRINGTVVGEIGMEAAIAGDFGVPLWLVTGDSAGMREAEATIPGVRTVSVKEAMGEFAARCLPPKLTAEMICEASKNLIWDSPDVKPFVFPGPVILEVVLDQESEFLDKFRSVHPELLVDDNTVRLQGQSVTEAWSWYLEVQEEVHLYEEE
jgi:D-amino peptidase